MRRASRGSGWQAHRRAWLRALACTPFTVLASPALRFGTAAGGLHFAALAEHAGKLQVQAAQGVLAARARSAIPPAVRELDGLLAAMRRDPATSEARDNLLLLALLWDECRAWAMRAPNRDNALGLSERVEEVAWVATRETRIAGGPGAAAPVELALSGAMLAQRAARLQLLRRWAPAGGELSAKALAAQRDLRAAIGRLAALPASPAQAAEVEVARSQLGFLERIGAEVAKAPPGPAQAEAIAKIADHLLEAMRRAARAFAAPAA